MSPKFETTVVHEVDAIVIYVSGEIDIAACERLRDAIEPNMGPTRPSSLTCLASSSWTHRHFLSSCRHEVP